MTGAIIWKELREQAAVVVALVVMGCGLMAAMAALLDPQQQGRGLDAQAFRTVGVTGAVMLTLAAGLVIGATLFAGEREAGTYAFLDRLPGSRWRIWWRKLVVGVLLAAVPAIGYFVVARLTGLISGPQADGQAALLFGAVTALAFAWGTLGSAWMRTSLGACAVGLALACITAVVIYVTISAAYAIVVFVVGFPWRRDVTMVFQTYGPVAGGLALAGLPLIGSAFAYTAPDRDRSIGGVMRVPTLSGEMATVRLRLPRLGLGSIAPIRWGTRLVWLLYRQHRVTAAWLGVVTLLAGFGFLLPNAVVLAAWPPVGLFVGVLLGVALFADEQSSESGRFWSERRLRVGRFWLAKTAFGAALLLALVLVLAVPSLGRAVVAGNFREGIAVAAFRSTLLYGDFPVASLLFLGPIYGFAFGQLAALIFRKAVIAAAVGLMIGGIAGALWMPSLVSGGVETWHLLVAPAVALLTSRVLAWSWTTQRLATRPALARLGTGLVVVLLVSAIGIAYRATSIPAIPAAEDDIAFAKSLPSFDEKQAGRDVRRAVSVFGILLKPVADAKSQDQQGLVGRPLTLIYEVALLPDAGGYFPADLPDRPDLDEFLARLDDPNWQAALVESATKATGVFIDPNEFNLGSIRTTQESLVGFRQMMAVYLALGLKAQRDGNPADFLERLRVALSVVNTTRNSGPLAAVNAATVAEEFAYRSLERWLSRTRGEAGLLRELLAILQAHELAVDTGYQVERTFFAEQTILRNSLDTPSQWMPQYLGSPFVSASSNARGPAEIESEVIGFLWAVPWERARLLRAIGYNNGPAGNAGSGYLRGVPGLEYQAFVASRARRDSFHARPMALTAARARIIAVAARLFEADRGRFPKSLDELVPELLDKVSTDPFAPDSPMNYRTATAGELIAVEPVEYAEVPVASDPLGSIPPENYFGVDHARAIAEGIAAVTGSVVFRNSSQPLVNADGTASRFPWSLPSPVATTDRKPMTLNVVSGQPVVWSVGPDKVDGGGRVTSTGPVRVPTRFAFDLVFTVPPPAPAR